LGACWKPACLQPGQALFLHKDPARAARIRPDGHLELDGLEGSIHGLGTRLLGSPCNGWDAWFYQIQPAPCTPSTTCARALRKQREV